MNTDNTKDPQNAPASQSSQGHNEHSTENNPRTRKSERLNTLILIIVLVAAGTVVAHSILTKSRCGRGAGPCGGGRVSVGCPYKSGCKPGGDSAEKSSCLQGGERTCGHGYSENKHPGPTCPTKPPADATTPGPE